MTGDLFKTKGMAVFGGPDDCYRYRLDRIISGAGLVYAFFGVNGSTATADEDDHTVGKWTGFTRRWNGSGFLVGNAFAYRSTDVRNLALAQDPIGPDNDRHIIEIADQADVLVPCWGSRDKLPMRLRGRLDDVEIILRDTGKPVMCLGLTKSGDPLHPARLAYATPLVKWEARA